MLNPFHMNYVQIKENCLVLSTLCVWACSMWKFKIWKKEEKNSNKIQTGEDIDSYSEIEIAYFSPRIEEINKFNCMYLISFN